MAKIIQRVNCVETPSGYLLTWDIAEGVKVRRTSVYGVNDSREFVIETPLCDTGRCLVSPENYTILKAFKLSVVTSRGELEESGNIKPQMMKKHERLLLNDIRRRFSIMMKSSPIGSYPCKILFRRIDGERCELCGSEICSGRGGELVTDYCPSCLGIGIKDPYFAYPKIELFHGETPKDDNDISAPEVQRSHVVRFFRSVFDLQLKENDMLVTGTEVYRIIEQKVSASVGNTPAVYVLKAIKIAPEDPKYQTLINIARGVNNE